MMVRLFTAGKLCSSTDYQDCIPRFYVSVLTKDIFQYLFRDMGVAII